MAQMTIDLSGKRGLAPNFWGDFSGTTAQPNLLYEAKDGQMVGGIYNPFKTPGYLSPANNGFKTITGAIANNIRASIYDPVSNDAYFAENSTQIWGLDDLTDVSLTSLNTVTGAIFTDMEIYTVNGTKKLFYSYQKSGGGNIGIASIPYASDNDTWLSATCSGGATLGETNDHLMIPADNGFMYILDGYSVHKIDGTSTGGTNGTASMNVVQFPTYFKLIDGIDFRGNLWIAIQGTVNSGHVEQGSNNQIICGVYIWDRLTSVTKMREFIPLVGVKEIRKIYLGHDNTIRLIVISANRTTQILKFDGNSFQIIYELGMQDYPVYRDSVQVTTYGVYWLTYGGYIYFNGIITPGSEEGLFKIGDIYNKATTWNGAGAILFGGYNSQTSNLQNARALLLSYLDGSTYSMRRWQIDGTGTFDSVTQSTHVGSIYTPVKFLSPISTINKIWIYMTPLGSGGEADTTAQATLSIYFNQSTTAWATKNITRNDIAKGYIEIEVNKQYINAIQFKITYSTSVTISNIYDFRPSFALINYQPTNTLK